MMQDDPPDARGRHCYLAGRPIGCKPTEERMGRTAVGMAPVARLAPSSLSQSTSS